MSDIVFQQGGASPVSSPSRGIMEINNANVACIASKLAKPLTESIETLIIRINALSELNLTEASNALGDVDAFSPEFQERFAAITAFGFGLEQASRHASALLNSLTFVKEE